MNDTSPWLVVLVLLSACGAQEAQEAGRGTSHRGPAVTDSEHSPVADPLSLKRSEVPRAVRVCFDCHRSIVTSYLDHGMARSLGPAGTPEPGIVFNPLTGSQYEIANDDEGAWLRASLLAGGTRLHRLVGRVGAGKFDTSWVGEEVDLGTGERTGRLFFAPVETISGHGHELAPFDTLPDSPGLDQAMTGDCLGCHTLDSLTELPGASTPMGSAPANLFPRNALGGEAFETLSPLFCASCHGPGERHLRIMAGLEEPVLDDLGLARLGELPAAEQRQVCARCHLQGDARIELGTGPLQAGRPLWGRTPVLVPGRVLDDFRFVSQVERLALSACFRRSPEMTCTTCHDPHQGVAEQGVAAFDATCTGCHERCSRHPGLTVDTVTGEAARTASGCVDCHVRRSQPFDLAHVRSADHYIRRRIPQPQQGIPHRQFSDPDGPLEIYHDGPLESTLSTPAGRRWASGVMGMALTTLGRIEEAARLFQLFPPPGTPAARQPSAPDQLVALETTIPFHEFRGLVLLARGEIEPALAAYSDALEIDPLAPGARLARARVRFDKGDVRGALEDTQVIIDAYPRSELPWELRAYMAERLGRPDLALAAYTAATARWPSNAISWYKMGLLLRQRGEEGEAREALARGRLLDPSLRLPGASGR